MSSIFISYAREDEAFVLALEAGLRSLGREIWIDRAQIPPSAEWLREIYAGIEGADAFLFVLSSDSAASKMCELELAHAVLHRKRIVPLLRREVDPTRMPPAIASLHWIAFAEGDPFDERLQQVNAIIDVDLDRVRRHTRLLVRAIEWDAGGRDASFVLRGHDLEEAVQWLAGTATAAPAPTPLQLEFIAASQKAEAEEVQRWKELYETAERQRRMALARHLAAAARFERGAPGDLVMRAALLAIESLRLEPAVEGDQALRRVLRVLPRRVGEVVHRHVLGLARFSADDRYIVAKLVGLTNAVIVWDTASLRELAHLSHEAYLHDFAFSPDGKRIATCGGDGEAVLWDPATGMRLTVFTHPKPVEKLAFSGDGTLLATVSSDRTVAVWRIDGGRRVFTVRINDIIAQLAFHPDGQHLVTATKNGDVRIWNPPRERPVDGYSHSGEVYALAFDHEGRFLATGSQDQTAVVWQMPRGGVVRTFEHDAFVKAVAWSRVDTRLATAGNDHRARVWSIETGQELACLRHSHYAIHDVSFHRDGEHLLTTVDDSAAWMWDLKSGNEWLFFCHDLRATSAAVSHAGDLVATTRRLRPSASVGDQGIRGCRDDRT